MYPHIKKLVLVLSLSSSIAFASNPAFDEGMFLLDQIPYDKIKQKYQIDLKPEMIQRMHQSSVRVSMGGGYGSGSFLSSNGLIYTNHHVVEDCVNGLRAESRISARGFFDAKGFQDEKPCKNYVIYQTLALSEVSEKFANVVTRKEETKIKKEIEEECKTQSQEPDTVCSVQRSGSSQIYLLEKTKAYRDVRLAYAPSKSRGFLGGDAFNFQFPRYALDFGFLRVYDEKTGAPIDSTQFYSKPELDKQVKENDFTMIVGHPGSTKRYLSAAALKYERNIFIENVAKRYYSLAKALDKEIESLSKEASPEKVKLYNDKKSERAGFMNTFQAFDGMRQGIDRADLIASRTKEEQTWIKALENSDSNEPKAAAQGINIVQILNQLDKIYGRLSELFPPLILRTVKGAERAKIIDEYRKLHFQTNVLHEQYRKFSTKAGSKQATYYDANSTRRFSYGSVRGIHDDQELGEVPFGTMYSDLKKHISGQLKLNGKPIIIQMSEEDAEFCLRDSDKPECKSLIVNFISDNDTTGGNSGSPVFNQEGRVIGALFDGNWRGLVGDYSYNADSSNRSVIVTLGASVQYMKNGNKDHRIYKELLKAAQ